jgi:hypothetical protein
VHKFKETQVVHFTTELNKRRAQSPKLRFKTKRDGFDGGRGGREKSRKSTLTQGFEKYPSRKLHKGSNGINITLTLHFT